MLMGHMYHSICTCEYSYPVADLDQEVGGVKVIWLFDFDWIISIMFSKNNLCNWTIESLV